MAFEKLKTAAEPHVAAFERMAKDASFASAPAWLTAIRRDGIASFAATGFPSKSNEEWKFTDVTPLVDIPFAPSFGFKANGLSASDLDAWLFGDPTWTVVVFVDGHYAESLSRRGELTKGVSFGSIAAAIKAGGKDAELVERHLGKHARVANNPFVPLGNAFFQDGAFVHVARGTNVEHPIMVLHLSTAHETGRVTHPRTLAIFDDETNATFIETFVSLSAADRPDFTNAVSEIVVGGGAKIDHYKLQKHEENTFHVGSSQLVQTGSGNFSTHTIIIGSRFVRNTLHALLGAEGIECTMNGLYLVTGTQHVDNHTAIDHAQPHCDSHELYKGILDGRARAVFNGKIFVRRDAQKTDAKQSNRNLILSDEAIVDTKPQLEIYADDVKCTHGATIGQLDEDALFYLQSRGIPSAVARNLLTIGFARDIIDRIKPPAVVKALDRVLLDRLQRPASGRGAN